MFTLEEKMKYEKTTCGRLVGSGIVDGYLISVVIEPKLVNGMKYYQGYLLSKSKLDFPDDNSTVGIGNFADDVDGGYTLKDAKEYINDYIKQEIDSGNFDTFRAYNN